MSRILSVPAVLAVAFLALPLMALLWKTPWTGIGALLTQDTTRHALAVSFGCAAIATAIAVALGVPLAVVCARPERRSGVVSRVLRAAATGMVAVPVVLPPVVGGVALLYLVGRRGLVGRYFFEATGQTIAFTPTAVVLAQAFVALPFLVLPVRAAVEALDHELLDAAATMGAGRWQTARYVILPLVGPSVLAGAVMCFARALGEFGATVTVAGNIPGYTRTVPAAVYSAMNTDPDTGAALAIVMLAVSIPVLVGTASTRAGRIAL